MDKMNINVSDDLKELVVRQGEAVKNSYPTTNKIEGVISAPRQCLDKKKSLYRPINGHVKFSLLEGTLTFIHSDKDEYTDVITGRLKTNPLLDKFKINTGQTFDKFDQLKSNSTGFLNITTWERD